VPVLLLNGGADPQDPPDNVAAAPTQMAGSLTVVVPGQGHGVATVGCLPPLIAGFIEAGRPDRAAADACIASIPLPRFRLS
jgi:TAP-like protein